MNTVLNERMPVVFVSDFGPMPAVESDDYTEALHALGRGLPRPRAVVVMSGHWEARGTLAVTAAEQPAVIHDYHGFPPHFYEVDYPAAGDPALAERTVKLLSEGGFPARTDHKRGLDHGAWVPLSRVYPEADVPVVQLTVPAGAEPGVLMAVGRALAPLRDEGVLLVGAGTLVHNLRLVHFHGKHDPPDAWAVEFERWIGERLDWGTLDEIADYRRLAPHAATAAPTTEHFDPLFFVLGAADGDPVTHHYQAIRWGNGSLRIFTCDPPPAELVP